MVRLVLIGDSKRGRAGALRPAMHVRQPLRFRSPRWQAGKGFGGRAEINVTPPAAGRKVMARRPQLRGPTLKANNQHEKR